MRVRASDLTDREFEDAPISVNASRDGLYFTTRRGDYRPGLNLLVSFPFIGPGNPMNCDFMARVARVEELANGRFGTGVQLLINLTSGAAANAQVAKENEKEE